MQTTNIILFLTGVFIANAHTISNATFDKFVSTHKLIIDSLEYNLRANNYYQELERVNQINENNSNNWIEELNPMSVWTLSEKSSLLGYNKMTKMAYNPKNKLLWNSNEFESTIKQLPTHVDWRDFPVMSAVKDQGRCGSCWAFASTAVIESHVAINTNKLFDLSPQQIAACAPNPDHCGGAGNCAGATAELAFDYVASSSGILEEFQYPYASYYGVEYQCAVPTQSGSTPKAKIDGYVKLPENNYQALMNAVAIKGPIAISVDASTWSSYKSGIFNGCNQVNPDINHAVVLVGYGEDAGQKYWLVRNSWSASWGESGYIRLARFENEEEICGTDITPQDGTACDGQTQPVKVCGTCGILYDSAYPTGATVY
jgi:cathepsin L